MTTLIIHIIAIKRHYVNIIISAVLTICHYRVAVYCNCISITLLILASIVFSTSYHTSSCLSGRTDRGANEEAFNQLTIRSVGPNVFDLCRPCSLHGFVFRVYCLQALVCFIHRGALWGMGLTINVSWRHSARIQTPGAPSVCGPAALRRNGTRSPGT